MELGLKRNQTLFLAGGVAIVAGIALSAFESKVGNRFNLEEESRERQWNTPSHDANAENFSPITLLEIAEKGSKLKPGLVSGDDGGRVVIRKPISEWLAEIEKTAESDPEIRSSVNQFAWAYLEENPIEATDWILSKLPDGVYAGAYEMMGAYYSKENGFSGVSELIDGLSVNQKAALLEGAFHHLAVLSTEDAIGFLLDQEEQQASGFPNRNRLVSKIFSGATSSGRFYAAIEAADSFLPKDLRVDAVDFVYRRWARRELLPSLNSIVESQAHSKDFDYILSGVFSVIPKSSYSEILTWSESVPLELRDRVKLILGEWNN